MLQLIRQMLEVGRRLITSSCLRKPSLIELYWKWLTALFGFSRDMTYFSLWDTDTDTLLHHLIVPLSKKVCTQCTHMYFLYYINVKTIHAQNCSQNCSKICHVHPKTYTGVVTFRFKCLNLHSQDDAADTVLGFHSRDISLFKTTSSPTPMLFPRATFCIEMNFKISNSIRYFFCGAGLHTRFISQPYSVAHLPRRLQDRRTVRTRSGDELPHNFFLKMSLCQHQHSPKDLKNICR